MIELAYVIGIGTFFNFLFVSLSLPCRIRGTVAQSARSSGLQETIDMKICRYI